ncbi:MAG TPA: hypothetical protein VFM05_14005 [Candidatus Saccharimonadales bacterium]|nr:hypothetical protein [Candidatus Saccharimonadales bacterium]
MSKGLRREAIVIGTVLVQGAQRHAKPMHRRRLVKKQTVMGRSRNPLLPSTTAIFSAPQLVLSRTASTLAHAAS